MADEKEKVEQPKAPDVPATPPVEQPKAETPAEQPKAEAPVEQPAPAPVEPAKPAEEPVAPVEQPTPAPAPEVSLADQMKALLVEAGLDGAKTIIDGVQAKLAALEGKIEELKGQIKPPAVGGGGNAPVVEQPVDMIGWSAAKMIEHGCKRAR